MKSLDVKKVFEKEYDLNLKDKCVLEVVRKFLGSLEFKEVENVFEGYYNRMGRPRYDCVLLFKILILQNWHDLSDQKMAYAIKNRIDFRNFLGQPENYPSASTIWCFREYIAKSKLHIPLWNEVNTQLMHKINDKLGDNPTRFEGANPIIRNV